MASCRGIVRLLRVVPLLWWFTAAWSMGAAQSPEMPWDAPHRGNPFIPGYYADASVLQTPQEFFVYATEDPWGGRTLGCWRSADMVRWRTCDLNWPTKEAATSPTSKDSMVWAPSVVAKNGRYYMYVSVGSEVWVGVADRPTGPWKNALGDKPLIPSNYRPGYHMIDAEAFVDADGQAYLYWGSGLNWVNGHCFVVRLKPDMVTFDGEPKDVTPEHYFEGPFLYRRGDKYILTYSDGKTTDTTYKVRYAVGKSPFGPFQEGKNSPLLVSDEKREILGPGHHAILNRGGKTYIVYHRHSLPFDGKAILRQLCIDELKFGEDGEPLKVVPTHTGPALLHQVSRMAGALPASASASSRMDGWHDAARATDDNYATRWVPAATDRQPWIQLDMGRVVSLHRTEIRFEYPWKSYAFVLESSTDGRSWKSVERSAGSAPSGSPFVVELPFAARYLRLSFPASATPVSLFEWNVF